MLTTNLSVVARGLIPAALGLLGPGVLEAQCPDGTPPPCGRPAADAPAPNPAEEAVPEPVVVDRSTVLIVPLDPIGQDTTLQRLAADFSAVVAHNLTIGELKAVIAPELTDASPGGRPAEIRRRGAGAYIDGTLARVGPTIRATVRLLYPDGSGEHQATVEGHPDSLLALADAASVPLLREWWGRHDSNNGSFGADTESIAALRFYIQGMSELRDADFSATSSFDSAVTHDPEFIAPWIWLSLPTFMADLEPSLRLGLDAMGLGWMDLDQVEGMPLPVILPDSARRALGRAVAAKPASAALQIGSLPDVNLVSAISAGTLAPLVDDGWPVVEFALNMQATSPASSERYVGALGAHYASLVGMPESTATAIVLSAFSRDSTFIPTRDLLLRRLIASADTTALIRLSEALADPVFDELWLAQLSERLVPSSATDVTFFGARRALIQSLGWHQYETVAPIGFRADNAPPSVMFEPVVAALVAQGRQDDTRQLINTRVAATGGGATGAMLLDFPLDPDIHPILDESIAGLADSLDNVTAGIDSMLGSDDAEFRLQGRIVQHYVTQLAWRVGTFAVLADDTTTARRAIGILQALSDRDTLRIRPLASGLEGEYLLHTGRPVAAESLLAQAVAMAIDHVPVRYRFMLARAQAARGNTDSAVRTLNSITTPHADHPVDNGYHYADALELEGALLDSLDRGAEAIDRFERFVHLRRNADASQAGRTANVHRRLTRLHIAAGDLNEAAWHNAQLNALGGEADSAVALALSALRPQTDAPLRHRPDVGLPEPGACPTLPYPPSLEGSGITGSVSLRFKVEPDGSGHPLTATVLGSLDPRADSAAIDHLSRCRFTPAMIGPHPFWRWQEHDFAIAPPPTRSDAVTAPEIVTPVGEEIRELYEQARLARYGDGGRRTARRLLTEALAADPEFAMGWRAYAVEQASLRQVDSLRAALDRAMSLRSRLSETEQWHIEALHAQYIDNDPARGLELNRRIVERNPLDWIAHLNIRLHLNANRQYAASLPHSRAVRALAPDGVHRVEASVLFEILLALGRYDEAAAMMDSIRPERPAGRVPVLLAQEQFTAAHDLLIDAFPDPRSRFPSAQNVEYASSLAARGAWWDALRSFESAMTVGVWGFQFPEARLALGLPLGCRDVGSVQLRRLPREGGIPNLREAAVLTVAGDDALADELVARFRSNRPLPNMLAPFAPQIALLDGLRAYRDGQWEDAITPLTPFASSGDHRTSGTLAERWIVADGFQQLGMLDSAIVYFQRVIEPRNLSLAEVRLRGFFVPYAHRRLAHLHSLNGNTDVAAAHWRTFR